MLTEFWIGREKPLRKKKGKREGEKRGEKRGNLGRNQTQKLRGRKENYNLKLNLHAEKEQ